MILDKFNLNDQLAMVVGNNSYCETLALALAGAGADIFYIGENPDIAATIRAEVHDLGRKVDTRIAKNSDHSQILKIVQEVESNFSPVDILVNCNSSEFFKPAVDTTLQEWHDVIDINLNSVFYWCTEVGKLMLKHNKGRIINVISELATRGLPNSTAYCASMGGIVQFTRALALEWAGKGIRVNALALGWFPGPAVSEDKAQRDALLRYIPTRRFGQPKDLEGLAIYLASEAGDFMTGQAIFVDGGVVARA